MVEATDAKELIDQAIERAEEQRDFSQNEERATEARFRNRISILVGILAVSLAIIHMAAAGAARMSLLKGIEASDTFNYMQAKIIRESIYKTAAVSSATDPGARAKWMAEAGRLRAPDKARHGIGQLQEKGDRLRDDGERATRAGEGYELGETALQIAIVLLSISLVATSLRIAIGAMMLAGAGVFIALLTASGINVDALL